MTFFFMWTFFFSKGELHLHVTSIWNLSETTAEKAHDNIYFSFHYLSACFMQNLFEPVWLDR